MFCTFLLSGMHMFARKSSQILIFKSHLCRNRREQTDRPNDTGRRGVIWPVAPVRGAAIPRTNLVAARSCEASCKNLLGIRPSTAALINAKNLQDSRARVLGERSKRHTAFGKSLMLTVREGENFKISKKF